MSTALSNTLRSGPDGRGRFGEFGGRFVAETLMPLILELETAYEAAKADPSFQTELDGLFVDAELWRGGVGRILVERAKDYGREHAASWLNVVGNPHAKGFYAACGFVTYGSFETEFGPGLLMYEKSGNGDRFFPRSMPAAEAIALARSAGVPAAVREQEPRRIVEAGIVADHQERGGGAIGGLDRGQDGLGAAFVKAVFVAGRRRGRERRRHALPGLARALRGRDKDPVG